MNEKGKKIEVKVTEDPEDKKTKEERERKIVLPITR